MLPNESVDVEPQVIAGLAQRAEALGYTGVWLPDHLLPPSPYGTTYGGVYEPLVTLSYIAASTTRVRLGTSVLLLALRDPFVVAKQAATLDRLSQGRFTLGVGIGWDRDEFAAVGADFGDRAGRLDEALRLLRQLFDVGSGPFDGTRFGFATGVFAPAPSDGLRIMVGGTSDAALRRAARVADVWQSTPMPPEQFADLAGRLRGQVGADRSIEVGARAEWSSPDVPVEAVADQVRQFESVGADHVAVWFGDADGFGDRMSALASALAA